MIQYSVRSKLGQPVAEKPPANAMPSDMLRTISSPSTLTMAFLTVTTGWRGA